MSAVPRPFAFSSTIVPTRVSAAYRLGLVVVATAMLLLPLLYTALIGGTGSLVWWHLTANAWILEGRSGQWRLLAYLAPAVVGIILMFFMVKPMLARPSRRQDFLVIDAQAAPALFLLIGEICRQVRAPRPQRVQVDCSVNASAGLLYGPWSPRGGLVLTIGLPLVAGLSIRQLAGVLAHEFGHFAQGGGLRLTGVVRGVNAWFGRVVYERDEWDVRLERWSRESDWRLAIVLWLAKGAVWVSRKVLYGLMLAGHAISCFMMRQMEYDADSYEIKVAGSETFIKTSTRLRELSLAARFAYDDLRQGLATGSLPENLPAFLVERGQRLSPGVLESTRQHGEEETGVFDTHPCDADRARAAIAAADPGVLMDADGEATRLFNGFDVLSAAATRDHFEHDLGLDVGELRLVDTAVALRQSQSHEDSVTALQLLLGDRWSVLRPLALDVSEPTALDAALLPIHLASARDEMARLESGLAERYRRFDELERSRQRAAAAIELLDAGFPGVNAADFGLNAGTADAARSALAQAVAAQAAIEPALAAYESAAARRLSYAVQLARQQPDRFLLLAAEVVAVGEGVAALASVIPEVRELGRAATAAALIDANAPTSPSPDHTAACLKLMERRVVATRNRIRLALGAIACPDGVSSAPMTLAERCGMAPDGRVESALDIVDRVFSLYAALLPRLATTVLQIEASLAASNAPADEPLHASA